MTSAILDRRDADPRVPEASRPRVRVPDDAAMLRAAADLTRDIATPDPRIYWFDMLASAALGYTTLGVAVATGSLWLTIAAGLVAVLALYRAGSFIHELTHVKHSALPGFRLGWNVFVGVPLLVPSFLYEGVHTLHHARTRYGTADDPEYLPLALMKPWTLPLFVVVSLLAPVALLVRFAVLAPLSAVFPRLRQIVVAKYSGLAINPKFARRAPEGECRTLWNRLEIAASLWAIALITMAATGVIPLRAFAILLAVASGVALLNQVRTLVAHLWENESEAMTVTGQYLDSVNVPPPSPLAEIWAPVGLRYHATHHLLPSLPYHALPEAHRRLAEASHETSPYHRSNYAGLRPLVGRLARATMVRR